MIQTAIINLSTGWWTLIILAAIALIIIVSEIIEAPTINDDYDNM